MADKDYSVNIGVGVEIDEASLASSKKKLESFQQAIQKALFDGGSMKFAVGGYSMDSMEQMLLDSMKSGAKGKAAERKLQQLADDFGDAFVGVVDLVEEKELDAKRQLNEVAQRYAKMIGVEFISEFAKSIGQPDFMLPAPEGSPMRDRSVQDFIPGKDGMPVISPAMFVDAIERAIANNPDLLFGRGTARGIEPGLSRGQLNEPFFKSAIPELEEQVKEDFFDLLDRATAASNAEAVGNYLKDKVQAVLDEIFRRGYEAREATFRSAGVTEGEDAADNLIRYADASARAAIAKAEEEFGLALGTLAKNIKIAGSQYFDFDAATVVGDGQRLPSDPNILRQVAYGDYNDPFTGTLMSTMQPDRVPDIMEQVFANPAIIASGAEGMQGLMTELSKFIKPTAVPEFDAEAYKRGLQMMKEEVEASGEQFLLAFDTEFNEKLPQKITEASIGFKDSVGKFQEVVGFVQAPPSSQYGLMQEGSRKSGGVAAGSFNELAKRAETLGIKDDIGAKDLETNFQQFYAKMQKLTGVLKIAAELDIPIAGSNIQGADYSRLATSINYINDKIVELGLELPKLEYPINQALLDTRDVVKNASKFNMPTAQALQTEALPGLNPRGVENILRNLVTQFPEALGRNLQRIELNPSGGFKIDGLDAHFARADNQAVLIIAEAMAKFEDLVSFMQTKAAKDYQPKKMEDKQLAAAATAAGGSGGGLDARRASAENEENARKRFLTERELTSQIKDLTDLEKKQVIVGLDRLQQTQEYKKLIEEEKSLKQDIADLERTQSARLAAARQADEGQIGPSRERFEYNRLLQQKQALEELIAAGKKLETQKRDQIKLEIRGKDVTDKTLQTTAKQIDEMNRLRSTTGGVGREIVGQLKEQAAAAKAVEQQNKSLLNSWVTGRYALYDVGNAYSEFSRQLFMVARQIFNITQAYRSYETAFTSVERTIQPLAATLNGVDVGLFGVAAETASLKDAFITLSEEIPVAFEKLSEIATLGAQMGVSAQGIVDFTRTVAEFSAVTGVAADTVAQKFGRIAELADVDFSEFNNLGSAILFAGINAVATESEIMTLTESIAAVSNQAGMLPAEIIGMSTALASTGIQAEQARGVFTRVFADIDRAVSRGGEELTNFAAVAGMSSEDFAAAWGTQGASYEVFRAMLGGLGAAEDLTATFDSLNIVETREINTLTRLSQNLNVVDQAISDANESFASGQFLGDAFGKTVDNLDSQIQLLNNNFKSLTEELSKSLAGSLTVVIGITNEFLQILKEMAKNPLFSTLTATSLAVTAFGAAAALAVGGVAKLVAQIYAFRVAAINTANDRTAISGIGNMLGQLTGFGGALVEMRDELKAGSANARGVITPMNVNMMSKFGDTVGGAASKLSFLSDKFKETNRVRNELLSGQNIYLANTAAEADAITQMVNSRKEQIAQIEGETEARSTHLARTQAEVDAINSENAARAKQRSERLAAIGGTQLSITTLNGEVIAYDKNQIALDRATVASKTASAEKRKEAAERLKNQVAIDTETRAASRASKMQLGPGAFLLGVASTAATVLSVVTVISAVISGIAAAIERTKINVLESGGGLASLRDAIKQDTIEFNKLTVAQQKTSQEFTTVSVKTKTYSTEASNTALAIQKITGVSNDFVDANNNVVEGIDKSTLALGNNTRAWFANAIMQDENFKKTIEKYPDLLQQLEEQGFDTGKILNDIFDAANGGGGDPLAEITKRYNDLYDQILILNNEDARGNAKKVKDLQKQIGVIELIKTALQSVSEALGSAVNENQIYEAIKSALGVTDDLGDSLDDTTDSADNLSEALRTVVDYANDLNGILSRVVELEFSKQMSSDDITTGWRNIAKSAKDAEKAVADANNEIKGLTADRSILEYQLKVAERYGDEARAAKIRAQLAKVNEQMADSENKLAEAQAASSKTLVGDSDAAIKNRSAILGMVGTYQSRIETLAKLGMNQSELEQSSKDLKRQFLTEAKALGFSGKELEKYASVFDNFAQAADKAPRDVDVEVIPALTAAEQAIQEFLAKDRSTTVNVKADTKKADDDVNTFVNPIKPRIIDSIKVLKVDKLAAEGDLDNWLKLEREFGAPKVTGITADAADRKINDWLAKVRITSPVIVEHVRTLQADAQLNAWLNRGRELSVEVKTTMKSSALAQSQATAALEVARAFPINSSNYNSYIEMYRALNKVANDLRGRGLASGGLVTGPGTGTSDSIPARLSNGEFVMRASAVNAYGVDFFNALNQQRVGSLPVGSAAGSNMSQGPSMVFLSPEDRQLLRQFGDRPVNLYADSTKIAEVANSGNSKMSRRGTR